MLAREAAARQCEAWRASGEALVFTNGVFDILHRGHAEYLAEARSLGDRLIVGVNADDSARRLDKGPGRPLNGLEDRAAMLAALRTVDLVVPFAEDTPLDLIGRLKPDVLVKGGDYAPEEVVGAEIVSRLGGQVRIIPFREGYSTTSLVERIRRFAD